MSSLKLSSFLCKVKYLSLAEAEKSFVSGVKVRNRECLRRFSVQTKFRVLHYLFEITDWKPDKYKPGSSSVIL